MEVAMLRVEDIMTASPEVCRPDDNLATAVGLLWKADCGVLPVVDHAGHVTGIITDRDICIALGTRNARASDLRVEAVMRPTVQTCEPSEDVLAVLAHMSDRRVRRIPVVDSANRLVGIVSLNDMVLAAGAGPRSVRPGAVIDAFKAVCAHRLPVAVHAPAVAGGPSALAHAEVTAPRDGEWRAEQRA
jgi:CBS domain-containing protein